MALQPRLVMKGLCRLLSVQVGKLLMTLGNPNSSAPKWQGNPCNRPTHVAVSPVTGQKGFSQVDRARSLRYSRL
jgi:hypothetical protein